MEESEIYIMKLVFVLNARLFVEDHQWHLDWIERLSIATVRTGIQSLDCIELPLCDH